MTAPESMVERAVGQVNRAYKLGLSDELVKDIVQIAIDSYRAGLEENGFVIVPREPTEGMLQKLPLQYRLDDDKAEKIWTAMITAALEE